MYLKSIAIIYNSDKCQSTLNPFFCNWRGKKHPEFPLELDYFFTFLWHRVLRFNEVTVLTLLIKMWIL